MILIVPFISSADLFWEKRKRIYYMVIWVYNINGKGKPGKRRVILYRYRFYGGVSDFGIGINENFKKNHFYTKSGFAIKK